MTLSGEQKVISAQEVFAQLLPLPDNVPEVSGYHELLFHSNKVFYVYKSPEIQLFGFSFFCAGGDGPGNAGDHST